MLALAALLGLYACIMAAFFIIWCRIQVDQSTMVVFTTGQGAVITLTTMAYNSYYKDRERLAANAGGSNTQGAG